MQESVRQYLSQIGSKGGQKATGDKKRRPREHYQRIQAISAANRKAGLVKPKAKPAAQRARAKEFLEALLKAKERPATSSKREKPSLPTFQVRPS